MTPDVSPLNEIRDHKTDDLPPWIRMEILSTLNGMFAVYFLNLPKS